MFISLPFGASMCNFPANAPLCEVFGAPQHISLLWCPWPQNLPLISKFSGHHSIFSFLIPLNYENTPDGSELRKHTSAFGSSRPKKGGSAKGQSHLHFHTLTARSDWYIPSGFHPQPLLLPCPHGSPILQGTGLCAYPRL